mmetsp:Transcript_57883/g.141973  ORF Transcript_57883/g.141973 Transcript_57883/m.141973 type:complete len:148 (-) Transcript_57883:582-1025(-)
MFENGEPCKRARGGSEPPALDWTLEDGVNTAAAQGLFAELERNVRRCIAQRRDEMERDRAESVRIAWENPLDNACLDRLDSLGASRKGLTGQELAALLDAARPTPGGPAPVGPQKASPAMSCGEQLSKLRLTLLGRRPTPVHNDVVG